MNRSVFVLVILSVLISSLAQIVLKAGMASLSVVEASQAGLSWGMARTIALNPAVLAGLTLYLGGAVVWLFVLAKAEVSLAYPFVGLGFIFTMLMARMVHGEALTTARVVGTLLITLGVLVLAQD